jgi:plastocyanin
VPLTRRLSLALLAGAVAVLAGCSADDPTADGDPAPQPTTGPSSAADEAEPTGPGGPDGTDGGDATAGPATAPEGPVWSDVLTIEDRRYHPDDLLAGAERELTIRNLDDEAHTVTSFDGAIDVEVGPGEEVEILTPEPGAYLYSCRFHPEMGGEIDVM